jgi:hypothetical protein
VPFDPLNPADLEGLAATGADRLLLAGFHHSPTGTLKAVFSFDDALNGRCHFLPTALAISKHTPLTLISPRVRREPRRAEGLLRVNNDRDRG